MIYDLTVPNDRWMVENVTDLPINIHYLYVNYCMPPRSSCPKVSLVYLGLAKTVQLFPRSYATVLVSLSPSREISQASEVCWDNFGEL
ncbi:hypothetical protein TSMEX_007859 [Taenia solium]|eukprot:TsM_000837300 transcript=TsM_000837300 gene=TsM_000837300